MNRQLSLLSLAFLLTLPVRALAQLPTPTYGWNLGNTMEPPSGVGTWGGKPSAALIQSVARAGFNTVRVPCAWDSHADKTTHKIDPGYLAQVKQVVDWCLAQRLHVIINAHWDGGWLENKLTGTVDPAIDTKMKAYWTQIAQAFAGYDSRLLFAGANEPNVDSPAKMAELLTYYQTFVDSVRATGGKNTSRWLIVSGPSTDIEKTNKLMDALPKDPTKGRLMVEVHYYTPYQFCLMSKDESWGKMAYFWGKDYRSTALPERNATFADEAGMDALFKSMHEKFVRKGIPVLLGEFRADRRLNNPELKGIERERHLASTTYWNRTVVQTAHRYKIAPIFWDTPGHLFDFTTGAVLDKDTIRALTGGPALPPPKP
ncbi:glycoside hydrolase family 5 protein [Armatimonas rosea]|uniref:Aryl-phospho-beta-D-glucosidase BglC (GH1 family) n=1 Tax=Armatimonas rosea TaxID=685828 RepID=A0A7W9SUL1_ARMRO|nr:glycoside hydrolase family 5 protein [Armatimonas rosea]MBB6052509.1 aryl-phospho-beta-D-glucosidase BglC (GH1 family) [Armatimonas rosea]